LGAEKGCPKSAYNYAVRVLVDNSFDVGRKEAWMYLKTASGANIQKVNRCIL